MRQSLRLGSALFAWVIPQLLAGPWCDASEGDVSRLALGISYLSNPTLGAKGMNLEFNYLVNVTPTSPFFFDLGFGDWGIFSRQTIEETRYGMTYTSTKSTASILLVGHLGAGLEFSTGSLVMGVSLAGLAGVGMNVVMSNDTDLVESFGYSPKAFIGIEWPSRRALCLSGSYYHFSNLQTSSSAAVGIQLLAPIKSMF